MRGKIAIFLLLLMVIGSVPSVAAVDLDKTAVVTGNDTGEVTLVVNGSSQTVNESRGIDVVLAIDSSGSMAWNDPDGLRKNASISFINQLDDSKDKVGVINWDNQIRQQQNLTSNFQDAKNTVNAGTNGETTNINLAINRSLDILGASVLDPSQRFIILLSDGEYNTGGNPLGAGQSVERAINESIKIYTIFLGGSGSTTMETIANNTGGKYFTTDDPADLQNIFDRIYDDITTTATNLVVTDIVPDYLTVINNSFTVTPNSIVTNPDNTTTLIWNIPKLGAGESWNVTYGVITSRFNETVPANVNATLNYIDPAGEPQEQLFPVPDLFWPLEEPIVPDVPDKIDVKEPVAADTIPMQPTGAPIIPAIVAALAIAGGLVAGYKN